jgi:N-acetylneuraminic acid mutarotase
MKPFRFVLPLLLALIAPAVAEWREGTRLPTAVPHAVAAEMDGKLYVMSGKVGQGLRSFFEQYDLRSDGWRPLTPLPANISQYAIAAGTGRVFVTGGRENNTARLSSGLWMYAPDTAVWLELGTLPSPRADHVSYFDGQKLFVFGGIGRDAAVVQSFNVETGKWSNWENPMPTPISAAAFTRRGDELIFAGGIDPRGRPVTAVQAFDLKTGKWRALPDLPLAASGGALAVIGGQLHFAGGFSPAKSQVLEGHNKLVGQRWQRQGVLPGGGRHRMAYYGNDDRFVLIGGAIGGGFYALFTASDRVSIFTP